MVQLRQKDSSSLVFYELVLEVKKITDIYYTPLIINDRIDIAMAVGAAGVHIGQTDLPAEIVRKMIGKGMLLGVLVVSVKEAEKAMQAGADYLGVGAMFPTETKLDADFVSMEELQKIRQTVDLPIVVIGGICKENAALFASMRIDGLAIVSAIIAQPDIKQAAAILKSEFYGKETKNEFEVAIIHLDGMLLNSMDIWERIDASFLQKWNFDWRYASLLDKRK